jgi:hypothetical protein
MTASQGGVALTAPCSLTGLSSSIYLCSTSIAFDPTLTGAWSLAFRNGGDSATSTTPTLAGAERPVPFVSGVTSSGSSFTPTFDFVLPPGFTPDGVRVVIFDRSVTPASALHSQGVSGTTRSFTVPATLSSGQALRANNPYSLSISLIETRDHVPFLTNPTDSGILNRSTAFFDFVTGPSAGGGVTLLPSVASVSGTVTVETPVSSQPAVAGVNVASGTLIQTGSDGTITLAFPGGTQLVVSPNTQVTLLPPLLPTGDDVQLNQVRGLVTHSVANPVPFQPDHYRVQTPVATVRPTGTNFSTQYSESGGIGALVVSVQQGQTEVANRRAELARLIAGQQGSFSDAVPRVTPILPVNRGSVIAGTVNTFSWTAFAAAGDTSSSSR